MLTIIPGKLTYLQLKQLILPDTKINLSETANSKIITAENIVNNIIATEKTTYGINTGFGLLANTTIHNKDLLQLQKNLILSHAAGVGDLLNDEIVRLIIALKINSLAMGYSGVRLQTIEALIKLYNAQVYPCIPSQGSVGASGDLAPLAHLSAILIGVGHAKHKDKIISAEHGLEIAELKPLELSPKEGLALINGTQVSTALALLNIFQTENIFMHALFAGAMAVDATLGSDVPFDARIHDVKKNPTQILVAKILRELLTDSEIRNSHRDCQKIQDPYSLRCQPQVMGACLAQLEFAVKALITEVNGVSDNPLIFSDPEEILSGGNFHAEPVAMAADNLALCIAEIGAISERRIALLIDSHFSDLPSFLVNHPGLNSGFMGAQVTAASLASENKSLAHPASVDSIPTSANQEDHVSMATFAAKRLFAMNENTLGIVAIELLAACQGLDFRRPLKSSESLEKMHHYIRKEIAFYDEDRFFSPDIFTMKKIINSGELKNFYSILLFFHT